MGTRAHDDAPSTSFATASAAQQAGIELSWRERRSHEHGWAAVSGEARRAQPKFGEGTRERAEWMKRGAVPVQFNDDLLPGKLPAYRAG